MLPTTGMFASNLPRRLRPRTLALLLGLVACWTEAAVTVTGSYGMDPWDPAPLGPGNVDKPSTRLWLGTGSPGSFAATAGSFVRLAQISLANGGAGATSGLLDGAGTLMELVGDGNGNRFEVGNSSLGTFTISGGAVLDGRASAAACLLGNQYCNNFIGNAAGSDGTLTVTGAGSQASFLSGFFVGHVNVNNGFGTPGATTTGRVHVLDGGHLSTDGASVANYFVAPQSNGQERSVGQVLIQGLDSRWAVTGSSTGSGGAYFDLAVGSRSSGSLDISAGGQLLVQAGAGRNYSVHIGNGGAATASIDGAGSALLMQGDAGLGSFDVATNGSVASLLVSNGGVLRGARWNNIGIGGGHGILTVNGAGSQAWFGDGSLLAGYGSGSEGTLQVQDGGLLQARSLLVGGGGSSKGSVSLHGAGSRIELSAVDTSRLTVGDWGEGFLSLSGGALMDASIDAAACATRWCDSFIGSAAGSTARLKITDSGSELRLLGGLTVGGTSVATQAHDGWNYGVLGGSTQASVEVLAGGMLITERVHVGGGPSPSGIGLESSHSRLLVDGPGSIWRVTGSTLANQDAMVSSGTWARGEADWQIVNGGQLLIEASAGRQAHLRLAHGGGRSEMLVSGGASLLRVAGTEASINVGENGGWARLRVADGARVQLAGDNHSYVNVGVNAGAIGVLELLNGGRLEGGRNVNIGQGGQGTALIDGAGSLLTTDRYGSFVGQLNVGTYGTGQLTVSNGGAASAFSLQIGNGYGNDSGNVLLDGGGSRIETDAVDWHRLAISNGALTVSGGAVLDATVNAAACDGHWCGTFLANNAGDHAVFTVTGAGSRASFLSGFNVGMAYVTAPPDTAWTLGRPGETSTVQLNVLNGGRLETEGARIGQGPSGPAATGAEGVQAVVKLAGAGSVWDVRGGPGDGGQANFFTGVNGGLNTQSDIQVRDGAQLRLHADSSHAAWIQLGIDGGQHSLLVSGAGSAVVYGDNNNAGLWIGRNGAIASVKLLSGGQIQGVNRVQVGNTGATGSLLVDGIGSAISYGSSFADLYVGRQGGFGSAQVLNGGRLDLQGNAFTRLYVGDGSGADGASGSLRIDGSGSAVSLQSPAFAAGSGWANPTGQIGWGGSASVQIVNGGQLTLLGQGGSAPNTISSTRLTIGQAINGVTGIGNVIVSGAGSLLSVAGVDPITYVGRSGGFGTLSVNNGGEVRSTLLNVGADGATGNLNVNGGTLNLSGQWVSAPYGSILSLGYGSGSLGSAFFGNGAQVNITNMGSAGAGLLMGGINQSTKGSGMLQVLNNSHVTISGQPGMNAVVVGLGGSSTATFDGGSSLTIAQGDVVIGQNASAVGTLRLLGGSTLTADYVGVGSTRNGDGGLGTLIVNDSVLTATTLEVGAKGYVGGNGTIAANVVNRGIFSPGNSPGTLTLTGSFVNQAGGRLVLEVESDGQGGFVTDHLIFSGSDAPALDGLQVSFHFLGTTDPNAFQASGGFRIGSFMQQQGGAGLDPQLFGGVTFSARADAYTISNFTFDAGSGAQFSAQPVPEPATWGMLLLGLGVLCRRRVRSA